MWLGVTGIQPTASFACWERPLLENHRAKMVRLIAVPDGVKPLPADIAQHVVIDPLIRAKLHIAIGLHQDSLEGRQAPLG